MYKAMVGSLTGSPLWGLSIEDVTQQYINRGWKLTFKGRTQTPYGIGPDVLNFETTSGRSIIWIPSYGAVANEDFLANRSQEKVFWILWQAGVKVLLVGGTSGITDWRDPDQAIHPGDLVLPWSFRTNPHHRGLPETELETFWPRLDVTMERPFCPETAKTIFDIASKYVGEKGVRKIHTTKEARVALVIPDGITFESDFDILMWREIGRMISKSQPRLPAVVTLHGDCINPLLARAMGIHLAYYHMVADYAQGLGEEIIDTLYSLYLGNFAKVAIDLEWEFLNNVEIPEDKQCSCLSAVHKAPSVFSEAMTND